MKSKKKRILITGATGTLGAAIAEIFAAPGNRIAIHCLRKKTEGNALVEKLKAGGADSFLIEADISNASEAARLGTEACENMGGIDLLVHAAAIFEKSPLGTVSEEQWDHILDVDLKGAFFLAQEVGMRMQRDGGRMIFLSDVAAARPYAGYLPYCIAKAGIDALVRGLAKSLAPTVLVNGIAPFIVTKPDDLSESGWANLISKTPARRASSPEEIAAVVGMLAESGESITGQIIAVDGGRLLR